ncbi:hypothetical protein ANN_26837 [Periplaneta americana]|uniref:Reverse transcriptase domain-containing protein n=1 Tax=Periplaneta americana TaxID=6978 RepID=A0ABQ8RZC4_PERAM|nr:hypothetical protein ANN_26837 [Periplaneta americana]
MAKISYSLSTFPLLISRARNGDFGYITVRPTEAAAAAAATTTTSRATARFDAMCRRLQYLLVQETLKTTTHSVETGRLSKNEECTVGKKTDDYNVEEKTEDSTVLCGYYTATGKKLQHRSEFSSICQQTQTLFPAALMADTRRLPLSYLETNNLILNQQSGFRTGKSIVAAVNSLLETVYHAYENGESTKAIFCDLSKAFGCVNHKILFAKLEYYGVNGKEIKLFKSYLEERFQIVSVKGVQSESTHVLAGVPQGSILGPLLFIVMLNDVGQFVNCNSKVILYADDTTFLNVNRSLDILTEQTESTLHKCKVWFHKNVFFINDEKTQMLTFTKKDISEGNQEDIKLLGFLIDRHLSWKSHIRKPRKRGTNTILYFSEKSSQEKHQERHQYRSFTQATYFVGPLHHQLKEIKKRKLRSISIVVLQLSPSLHWSVLSKERLAARIQILMGMHLTSERARLAKLHTVRRSAASYWDPGMIPLSEPLHWCKAHGFYKCSPHVQLLALFFDQKKEYAVHSISVSRQKPV